MIAPPLKTTQEAIAYGLTLTPSELPALRAELAADRAALAWERARAEDGDMEALEEMMALGFRCQMLREAHEAATGTGGIGELLTRGETAYLKGSLALA